MRDWAPGNTHTRWIYRIVIIANWWEEHSKLCFSHSRSGRPVPEITKVPAGLWVTSIPALSSQRMDLPVCILLTQFLIRETRLSYYKLHWLIDLLVSFLLFRVGGGGGGGGTQGQIQDFYGGGAQIKDNVRACTIIKSAKPEVPSGSRAR